MSDQYNPQAGQPQPGQEPASPYGQSAPAAAEQPSYGQAAAQQPAWGQQQPQESTPSWGQQPQPAAEAQPTWGQSQPATEATPAWGQPAADQSYGQQPAAEQSYGQQPSYGQSAPAQQAYGQQPSYGQQEQSYGQQPAYGQSTDQYGQSQGQYGQGQYGQGQYGQQAAPAAKKWKGITITAFVLAGVGLIVAFLLGFSGFGGLFSIGAVITGHLAMKRNPEAKPWPLIAALVGYVGVLVSLIAFIITLSIWLPYFSAGGSLF